MKIRNCFYISQRAACIVGFMFCIVLRPVSQQNGVSFTAKYQASLKEAHTIEKDNYGNIIKATHIVTGDGTHSIMGAVSTMSTVQFNASEDDNVIEFVETDSEGNSIFVITKGSPGNIGSWICHGAIVGGTGKYKTASGSYKATGTTSEASLTWTAEGMLYSVDPEAEKKAIKKVIIAETEAYQAADNKRGKSLRAPHYTHVINLPKDQALLTTITNPEDEAYNPNPIVMTDISRTDWDIQLRSEVAWVTFKQMTTVLDSRVPTIETRILEKIGGQWKISHMQTTIDYAHAQPPLIMGNNTGPQVYSVHELELKPGVTAETFENFFLNTIAPLYNRVEGHHIILAKGDRGQRKLKYSAIVVFDSIEDRNRIYPIEGGQSNQKIDWGPQENWVKLATMVSGLGTEYTDHVSISN